MQTLRAITYIAYAILAVGMLWLMMGLGHATEAITNNLTPTTPTVEVVYEAPGGAQ